MKAIIAFEAAARRGSMSRAAEELCVTHGAVSRQIKILEQQIGIELFEGPKNSLTLTKEGRDLAQTLSFALDQIKGTLATLVSQNQGVVDLSCLSTFTMRWLIPRLHEFGRKNRDIDILLSSSDEEFDPSRDRFDIAIRVGPPGQWGQKVVAHPFLSEFFGPVASPDFIDQNKLLSPSDLRKCVRLHTKTREDAWINWYKIANLPFQPSVYDREFEHFYFMLEAAISGLGVGVAPYPLVCRDIATARLAAPFGFVESGLEYVGLRRLNSSVLTNRFLAWIVESGRQFEAESYKQYSSSPFNATIKRNTVQPIVERPAVLGVKGKQNKAGQ